MKFSISNSYLLIRNFKKEYIDKKFLTFLNDKKINKYLSTNKKKQNLEDALRYFNSFDDKSNIYLAIFDKKKKSLYGTITLRKINNDKCYLGFMIGDRKYLGTKYSSKAFNIFLCFIFRHLKFKQIIAGTDKKNLPSNFSLVTNGFKIFKKTKKNFYFILQRENLLYNTAYKIDYHDRLPRNSRKYSKNRAE